MVDNAMQVDTGTTQEIRTTMSTLVSVTAVGDNQPVTKKAKMESGKESQVKMSTTVTSMDALDMKKTRTGATESKSRSDYKNSDLPIPVDHKWTNAFMDTIILWAGGQLNIWSIPDETLAVALQAIFTVVYPNIQYEVTIHGAVFGVAWQRLLEWCSGFRSTVLVIITHFFWEIVKGNPDSEDSNAAIRDIAKHFISPPQFPFTHEDCDKLDPAQNFCSEFILKLISTVHLSKMISAVDIESLGTAKLKKGYGMECTVALAAAVVKLSCDTWSDVLTFLLLKLEHAFTLVRDGVIDVQDAMKEMAEKKGKITLPKTLNKTMGNMSKGISMFSVANWGSETQSYAISVTKKSFKNTADIISCAYALLDRGSTSSGPSDADTVDLCALLWYLFWKFGLY
ncbi:hypothetical protein J3R83DRAFT_11883 [Lanmaoa asiatica]|nr:hypothetical protein J3R83DRAFT_11883 [Lanmaoa asiatica]